MRKKLWCVFFFFFFQAEDGIRDTSVTGVQTCALPISGVGIPAPLDWEQNHPPDPAALAEAVRRMAERLDDRRAAARERALRFDLRPWEIGRASCRERG